MSLTQLRGGIPHVRLETVATTGQGYVIPFNTFFLKIRVSGNPCLMFFTEADFDADINYITVPEAAAETPYGEWEGPVELHIKNTIWLKGSGGNSVVELVAFQRRG